MNYFKKILRLYYILVRKFRNSFSESPFFKSTGSINDYSFQTLSNVNGSIFFGYHDKTPFNHSDDKVLSMLRIGSDFNSTNNDEIQLGYFEKNNKGQFINKFIPFSSSNSWCWQQGCMLQWLQNSESDKAIYNTIIDCEFGSEIYCFTKKSVVKKNRYPIYSLSPDGMYASSLNFSALGVYRPGYGYNNFKYAQNDVISKHDGLFCVNLQNDKKELLVSLYDLSRDLENADNYYHYINHCSFSPDSQKLSFFHVLQNKAKLSKQIRFCIYDLNAQKYHCVEDNLLVSHYCWINNKTLLVSVRDQFLNWSYKKYDIILNTNISTKIKFYTDGHPMISPVNKEIFVTDTSYPDKNKNLHLFISDTSKLTLTKLKLFYTPVNYNGEIRCDLHPRWNCIGDKISVDICSNEKREMGILYLN